MSSTDETKAARKKVLVSGCFDLLHSGHVEFLQEAANYGDLYVALGSDRTVCELKGRPPINDEQERLFMLQALRCVHHATISPGSGMLDFEPVLDSLRPDVMVVNDDGNVPAKEALCRRRGVAYVVLRREPHTGLAARSTTALRRVVTMPFRIDLAGGWLDQPFVSKHCAGPVIMISIEPTVEFNNRSGMASSTRANAIKLWGPRLPSGEPQTLAQTLFCCDNPPGTHHVSGSQDAIGIVFPGLNIAHYSCGEYWPARIESVNEEATLKFLEDSICMIPIGPRGPDFEVLDDTVIDYDHAKALRDAAVACWDAILRRDIVAFGTHFRESYEAQIAMFPHMVNELVVSMIAQYKSRALGWKLSGAGGGGYLILISETPIEHSIRIKIRRKGN